MRTRGKRLTFDDEELHDLADAWYDGRAYSLLFLLYGFVDTAKNQFHIDHVFPRALMTPVRLKKAGVDEEVIPEYRERVNRLANLQLLEDQRTRARVPSNLPTGCAKTTLRTKGGITAICTIWVRCRPTSRASWTSTRRADGISWKGCVTYSLSTARDSSD